MLRTSTILALGGALCLLPATGHAQSAADVAQGAQLYATTCSRCHNARAATERTDRDWTIIMAKMRARANITKSQAASILAFLQATNLPEGPEISQTAAVVPASKARNETPGPESKEESKEKKKKDSPDSGGR